MQENDNSQLSPAVTEILDRVSNGDASAKGPQKGQFTELPFEAKYPNLYGVYGAAKEVGKTLLPWVKYIDPAERDKFMQLSQQEQVRDLLLEDLNFVTLGRWKPLSQFAKEVGGAAMQTYLPKTYEVLTKARKAPLVKGVIPEPEPTKAVAADVSKPEIVIPADTPIASEPSFAKVNELAGKWDSIVERQKRGIRPHELARQEAEGIGYTYDEIKNIAPGTTMNDSQVVALTNTIKTVADETLTAAQAGDKEGFLKRFLALGEIDPARWGVRTEAGRTLSIMNEPISGINQYLDQFTNALQAGNITPERLMAMVSKLKTPAQMAEIAKAAQKPGFTDAVMEVWINGLLSGPVTHMANIIGNSAMIALQPVERLGAATIGKVLPGESQVAFGEVPQLLYGMIEGMKDGFRLAGKALMEGNPQTGAQKIEWKNAINNELVGLSDENGFGKAINLLGNIVRSPGRALMSEDEFFKAVAGRMELRARVYREGVANGFEKEDLAKFMAQELNKPSNAIQFDVSQFQKYVTFQSELGKSGQAFQEFVSSHPAFKFIFPFVKTPANIFKSFGERTPLALFAKGVQADIRAGGSKRDLALSRISLGSSLMAIVAYETANGRITGGGPSDPKLRANMMREGWQPYSIKIGKTYHSYQRIEPFSTLIGVAASATELMGQVEGDEIEAEKLPVAVIAAFSKNILDKTFTTGAANMILALEDPDQYGKQYVNQLAGSAVPAFSAQLSRSIEGDAKEIMTLMDSLKARIPGYAKDVPSKVDIWGEPIKIETLGPSFFSPIRTSEVKDSPVDREMTRNRIGVSKVDKKIEGVQLTPQEYQRYAILAGNEAKYNGVGLKESLTALIETPEYLRQSEGPDGGKALMIRAQFEAYRQLAKAQLMAEFPELSDAIKAQRMETQQKRQPLF